ncbi:trigger factor [Wolbachia endosymbiont of Howardula sp.]|nr:trigger factor [Wolbachia endosymbiont of Howardula sp.]UWI83356.1 trigger factor [Wolbachia endosymbiont of Howardula sp.]
MSNNTVQVDIPNNIYMYRELKKEKLKYEYEITVSREYLQQALDMRLQRISESAKSPGFRSGKIPYPLIVKNFKNEALQYVTNHAIEHCAQDLVKKFNIKSHVYSKVKIISMPDLDQVDKNKGQCIYTFSFERVPDVPSIVLDTICLKNIKIIIDQDDIEEYLESLKSRASHTTAVEDRLYQAQNGDQLIIDFEGRIRNKLFKGGSKKNVSITIGACHFITNFENQLIGMRQGETKRFKLIFPDDYTLIALAGQEAEFIVHVHKILVIIREQNHDTLIESMGFKDHDALIQHAKTQINKQCQKMSEIIIKKELFDYLDSHYSFDLPINIVQDAKKRVTQELRLEDNYLLSQEAEKRVKLGMLFMQFSVEHKILLNQNDILQVIAKQHIHSNSSIEKVLKYFQDNKQFQDLVKGQALEYKVTNYIIEQVKKREHVYSVKELKNLLK